jgi:hypothetical protein
MIYAYSQELSGESIPDSMTKNYDTAHRCFHYVTFAELEKFARTIAYKVAHNLKNGYPMDESTDPLTYIDCGGNDL